jgi:DNA-binding NtrC family response regulator
MEEYKILVVDDEPNMRTVLRGILSQAGYSVVEAGDGQAALDEYEADGADLVMTDLKMPVMDGLELLGQLKETSDVPVVMMTAHGTVETAVEAMKKGAFDYIAKPLDKDQILAVIEKALAVDTYRRSHDYMPGPADIFEDIVGTSRKMLELFAVIERVAPTDASVLVTGESGTGKEMFARAIHNRSKRSDKPFVAVNCAALPENLIESELFGHEKGAFTGAIDSRVGRFELADCGTIFLDEIGELPVNLQSKLLRVLQQRSFERVGGIKAVNVDVRVLAATNRDLQEEAKEGRFREDLFFRLNVVPIDIPPLRDRREDIEPLLNYFLKASSEKMNVPMKKVQPRALDAIVKYNWPGNVRELENMMERLMILSAGEEIGLDDLPSEIVSPSLDGKALDLKSATADSRTRTEKQLIVDALERTGGNRTKAARILGISRRTLQHRLNDYGLQDKKKG